MASLTNPFLSARNLQSHFPTDFPFRLEDNWTVNASPPNLCFNPVSQKKGKVSTCKRSLTVQAGYSNAGRPGSASVFIGGFILGGIVVGTLGAVYAPQISKTVAGTDGKDLMRKLPKFIYDEEKALERTRKTLAKKIDQLNSAIDDVSSQLHSDDVPNGVRADDFPNGVPVSTDEIEATA